MSAKENGCANDSPDLHTCGLDDILVEIGQLGKFQLRIFVCVFALILFHTITKDGFIFTASSVVYRCRLPECDGSENFYDKPWTEFSIPKTARGQLEKCQRYKTFNATSNGQNFCYAENYDHEFKTECGNDFIFRDNEVTISTDFKIFCSDEWKLAMVGTINNFGQFIGIPLGGYLSDRYGRVAVLAYGGFTSAITGIVRSYSPIYYIFIVFGFLDNLLGSSLFGTMFVLLVETLGPSIRVHASTLVLMSGGISRCLLAVTAKKLHNWRFIERFFYIPALVFITLPWVLSESFRWLLSQKEEQKAIQILQKAAKTNKRKILDSSIEKLLQANRQSLSGVDIKNNKIPIGDAFKIFPWRIINCAFCWFTCIFVVLGLNLNSALLGRNKYDSFMYASLIEIPGTLLPSLTINRYGRKISLFGYLLLTGICITAMNVANLDAGSLRLVLYLLGKMTISASVQILYVFTSEIFPTNARSTLLSFCSMIGRLGSMVAPQTPLMAKYHESIPAILFASSTFLSGCLILFIPETKDSSLPTTLQDAEKIGQKETKVKVKPEVKLLMTKI